MSFENLTVEEKRQNADYIVSKQLHYLERILLKNINFAEKAYLNESITKSDQCYLTEMSHELLELLADVRDDYDRKAD